MFGKAGDLRHLGSDADVDRGDVVADRRAIRQVDQPLGAVDGGGGGEDQPGAGVAGEFHQVDLERGAGVVAGDMAGQHAGIGRGRVGVDHGQPGAGQRVSCPSGAAPAHGHGRRQ